MDPRKTFHAIFVILFLANLSALTHLAAEFSPEIVRCHRGQPQSLNIKSSVEIIMASRTGDSAGGGLCRWTVKVSLSGSTLLLFEWVADDFANSTVACLVSELLDPQLYYKYQAFRQAIPPSDSSPKIVAINSSHSLELTVNLSPLVEQMQNGTQRMRLRIVAIRRGFCGHRSLVHSGASCYRMTKRFIAAPTTIIAEQSARPAQFGSTEQLLQFGRDVKKHNEKFDDAAVNLSTPHLLPGMRFCHESGRLIYCNCSSSANQRQWKPFLGMEHIKLDSTDKAAECVTLTVNATGAPTLGLVRCNMSVGYQLPTLWEIPDSQLDSNVSAGSCGEIAADVCPADAGEQSRSTWIVVGIIICLSTVICLSIVGFKYHRKILQFLRACNGAVKPDAVYQPAAGADCGN